MLFLRLLVTILSTNLVNSEVYVTVKATGCDTETKSSMKIDNTEYSSQKDGINVLVIDPINYIYTRNKLDKDLSRRRNRKKFKKYFTNIKNGLIVVIATQNHCNLNYNWLELLPNSLDQVDSMQPDSIQSDAQLNTIILVLCQGGSCPVTFEKKFPYYNYSYRNNIIEESFTFTLKSESTKTPSIDTTVIEPNYTIKPTPVTTKVTSQKTTSTTTSTTVTTTIPTSSTLTSKIPIIRFTTQTPNNVTTIIKKEIKKKKKDTINIIPVIIGALVGILLLVIILIVIIVYRRKHNTCSLIPCINTPTVKNETKKRESVRHASLSTIPPTENPYEGLTNDNPGLYEALQKPVLYETLPNENIYTYADTDNPKLQNNIYTYADTDSIQQKNNAYSYAEEEDKQRNAFAEFNNVNKIHSSPGVNQHMIKIDDCKNVKYNPQNVPSFQTPKKNSSNTEGGPSSPFDQPEYHVLDDESIYAEPNTTEIMEDTYQTLVKT